MAERNHLQYRWSRGTICGSPYMVQGPPTITKIAVDGKGNNIGRTIGGITGPANYVGNNFEHNTYMKASSIMLA